MLGLRIDSYTDEQRDRIIRVQNWTPYHAQDWDGNRCLIGHAEMPSEITGVCTAWGKDHDTLRAQLRFTNLCHRFGMGRIVRLCKLRAAKGNGVDLHMVMHHEN